MNFSFINNAILPPTSSENLGENFNNIKSEHPQNSASSTRIYEPIRGSFFIINNNRLGEEVTTLKLNKYFQSSPTGAFSDVLIPSDEQGPEQYAYNNCDVKGTITFLTNNKFTGVYPIYFEFVFGTIYNRPPVFDYTGSVVTSGNGFEQTSYNKFYIQTPNFTEYNQEIVYITTNYNTATTPTDDTGNKLKCTNLFYDKDTGEYFLNFHTLKYKGAVAIKGTFNLY